MKKRWQNERAPLHHMVMWIALPVISHSKEKSIEKIQDFNSIVLAKTWEYSLEYGVYLLLFSRETVDKVPSTTGILIQQDTWTSRSSRCQPCWQCSPTSVGPYEQEHVSCSAVFLPHAWTLSLLPFHHCCHPMVSNTLWAPKTIFSAICTHT